MTEHNANSETVTHETETPAPRDEQTSPAPGPAPDREDAARADAPQNTGALSPELEREIDDAMRALDSDDQPRAPRRPTNPDRPAGQKHKNKPPHKRPENPGHPSIPGAKPAIRGPRVIEAGRERRPGAVVSVGPTDIFIEFGPKELGVAPRAQWPDDALPIVGETLEVVIDRFEPNESLFICSKPGSVQKADWELLEPGQTVEARVTAANKGGLTLEIAKHDAFMPASLIDTHHIEDLSVFVGEKVACRVERIDRSGRGKIVLNRRAVLAEQRKEQEKQLRETLSVGQTVTGKVRKIMPFGAFVDLGGVDGLVHVSDLSHSRVEKVEDVVKEGDELTLQILKLDWDKGRISLGLKQTQPDPFEAAAEQFPPETIAPGKVTRITNFGAFIELAPGVEGLVHISELDWGRVRRVEDAVRVGQTVKVKVITFDPSKQRVSLSVKQTTKAPAGAAGETARSEEEIRKETPKVRRMREEFKRRQSEEQARGLKGGGFGDGLGLGDLKL